MMRVVSLAVGESERIHRRCLGSNARPDRECVRRAWPAPRLPCWPAAAEVCMSICTATMRSAVGNRIAMLPASAPAATVRPALASASTASRQRQQALRRALHLRAAIPASVQQHDVSQCAAASLGQCGRGFGRIGSVGEGAAQRGVAVEHVGQVGGDFLRAPGLELAGLFQRTRPFAAHLDGAGSGEAARDQEPARR